MTCPRLIVVALIQLALVVVAFGPPPIHVTLQEQRPTLIPSLSPSTETQICVKEVDARVVPKCKILFREEGGWPHTFNATCVKQNVFLVQYDRPVSDKITRTSDQILFSSLYGEKPPPYSRILCSAPFPIDFEYQGPGVLDFLRIWKSIKYPEINTTEAGTTYNINAEVLLTPEATGRYAIHSIAQPNILTSFFIFSTKPERPYLLGAETEKPFEAKESGTNFILPCITTNYNVTLALFKQLPGTSRWMLYNGEKVYDPEEGYSLPVTTTKPGDKFKCSTGVADDEDSVVVNIPAETPSETVQRASKLKIEISENGGSATCQVLDGQHGRDMKFYNVYVRNPTESHLVADCLLKGRPNCGGHTYHDRKDGRILESPLCKNATSCSVITSLHREGLLVCITETDSISLEYFTGLDNKIYKDWNLAPWNALIRPRCTQNTTNEFTTGTKYEFKCESVGFLFVKDPFVISVRYKNGTLEKLAELVWWQSGKEFYLTSEMDQIMCSDELWSTHEVLNSTVKVNVTVKKCMDDQFTCHNGQCIRDSWRCDGDKDCTDATDEDSCLTHICKPGYFKCNGGQCVSNEKTCNNKRECPDGSDESPATCLNKTCNTDDFKCNAGQCIPAHFLCDGDKDCIDESDEAAESCSKYYPQITGVQKATFTENSLNELVCETNALPTKLVPRLEWWFQDKNITDQHRLWKDLSGSKLALRFPNVSVADQGIYTCFAQNMLIKVKQTFTVEVKQLDISCRTELPKSECLRRGCAFDSSSKSCHDFVEFVEPGTTTTTRSVPVTPTPTLRIVVIPSSTTTVKPKPPKDEVVIPGKLHIHEPIVKTEEETEAETEEAGHALEWTFGIITFLVLSVLVAGLVWRYYYSRHVPSGSARMRDDDQVTLNGI